MTPEQRQALIGDLTDALIAASEFGDDYADHALHAVEFLEQRGLLPMPPIASTIDWHVGLSGTNAREFEVRIVLASRDEARAWADRLFAVTDDKAAGEPEAQP